MNIYSLNCPLEKLGLAPPALEVLVPNEQVYSSALFQPCGSVVADANGVRLANAADSRQFEKFIDFVCYRTVHLAVCPEYSMPREVLLTKLAAGSRPRSGALWVFGCDSVPVKDLPDFVSNLESHCKVIVEDSKAFDNERFLNPVVYLFGAQSLDGKDEELVAVIQFKTHPSADKKNFEPSNLQTGTRIYKFGANGSLNLLTFICSDALELDKKTVRENYDETLILHLQMNTGFRHADFRHYRDVLFYTPGDRGELICLNWCNPVKINGRKFGPLGGSAWYLRTGRFDGDCPINCVQAPSQLIE